MARAIRYSHSLLAYSPFAIRYSQLESLRKRCSVMGFPPVPRVGTMVASDRGISMRAWLPPLDPPQPRLSPLPLMALGWGHRTLTSGCWLLAGLLALWPVAP